MIITASLAWYAEPPELLEACVRGAGLVADRIVALDGAFRRFPGGKPHSDPAQVDAIRETAAAVGLECLILQPDRLWAGAVEKRSYLLPLSAVGADWLAILDADHIITTNRRAARHELEGYGPNVDVVSVPFFTPMHPVRSLADSSVSHWHERLAGETIQLGHFLRALPGLRVENYHYHYSGLKQRGERVWLPFATLRPIPGYRTVPVHRMVTPYRIDHLTLLRDEAHLMAARAFYNDRVLVVQQTGQEDDVPGLPPPVWDYETVPF